MPRCRKARCCRPLSNDMIYKPTAIPWHNLEVVELALDEYEALRLCDGEGLQQIDAGVRMGISRGTVQRLLAAARHKVATALDQQHALRIVANGKDDEDASQRQ